MTKNYSIKLLKMNRKDMQQKLKRNSKLLEIITDSRVGDKEYWTKLVKDEKAMLDDLDKSIELLKNS